MLGLFVTGGTGFADTVNVAVVVAVLKLLYPFCLAVIVHIPSLIGVIIFPEILAINRLLLEYVKEPPLLDEGVIVTGVPT